MSITAFSVIVTFIFIAIAVVSFFLFKRWVEKELGLENHRLGNMPIALAAVCFVAAISIPGIISNTAIIILDILKLLIN